MQIRQVIRTPLPTIPSEYWLASPLILGFVGWIAALGTYKIAGYRWEVAAVWAASIAVFGWGIWRLEPRNQVRARIPSRDVLVVLLLLSIFGPLYLVDLYSLPFPVHNDEVELMRLEIQLSRPGVDLFGISQYLSMPVFLFSSFGWVGRAIGGIELSTMRSVHAGLGLLTIAVSYVLFRLSAPQRMVAFGAAVMVGVNHSLWMLSRMALWDNSALLFELIALAFLIQGLRTRSPLIAFIGGVAAGIGFYVYLPARVTVVLWVLMLACLGLFFRRKIEVRSLLMLAAASVAGCVLVALPLFITNTRPRDTYSTAYRLMISPEGLEHQRLHASGILDDEQLSTFDGYLYNVRNGLGAFNSREWDGGGMYQNPDHGIVDPLTGTLLWIGLAAIVLSWRGGNLPRYGDLLTVVSFFSLLFVLAFVINQAPNYTRMLVLLPFAAYGAARGLYWLASQVGRGMRSLTSIRSGRIRTTLFGAGIIIVGFLNFQIVGDYVRFSWEEGSIRGSTARYLMARTDELDFDIYVVANAEYPYYEWGDPDLWLNWAGFFADPDQALKVLEPAAFLDTTPSPPFVAFMSRGLFEIAREDLYAEFSDLEIEYMMPDKSVLAMEIR